VALREDMRSMVEAQEAANEELQSVNEEIVSSNEELQSINEEMETSKEELESSNEELLTINQELQVRNEQLAEVQEYSEAMFATVRESLLVLDKKFRIKHANYCFYKSFGVTEEETQGRLLYDVGNKQWNIPEAERIIGRCDTT
jgi:two-component system CheB/CheR fusion protein